MNDTNSSGLFASHALLPYGWARDVSIAWDENGKIVRCEPGVRQAEYELAKDVVVPGMVNLHSHAFQRSLTGRAQRFSSSGGDFWSWREAMYAHLAGLTPETYERETTALYRQMLLNGYTTVCEFHYVHNDVNGLPYSQADAMSEAVFRAASASGIRLTLLPVLYTFGGPGRKPPETAQRRFILSTDDYLSLIESIQHRAHGVSNTRVGYAPHSIRAVDHEGLHRLLEHRTGADVSAPVHIHISEQKAEIDACLRAYGTRPVEWLMARADVDENWCLIHCTHADEHEQRQIEKSKAVVGLCPTTEADLGDGIFPFAEHRAAGAPYGIGSDSNLCTRPFEELRLLEFVQRLVLLRRNLDGMPNSLGVGALRWLEAAQGGAAASGQSVGRLAPDFQADFLVIDTDQPLLSDLSPDEQLSAAVFSGDVDAVSATYVSGKCVYDAASQRVA